MIWPDYLLRHACETSGLVTEYDEALINPASIDLRLGNEFVDLHTGQRYVADEITLRPGDAILATTLEYVRIPVDAAACIYLKSSSARKGLDHALAGWIDPGFCGQVTLELHAHREVTFQAGQRVVQMVVMEMMGSPDKPYQGRYQNQSGPTEARPEKP